MKKFIVYLLVIVLTVSLGFAVFYLVRDNEIISISSASMYKDVGDNFTIDVDHTNKKKYTEITIASSDDNIVSYNKEKNNFQAKTGGVARINFRSTNAKFRNLWCDVIVGDGTIESPFYISTAEQLASIGMGVEIQNEDGVGTGVYMGAAPYQLYRSDMCYKLVAAIDVSKVHDGYWIPLRNFSGRFDGNGLTISNVNIDKQSYDFKFSDSSNYDPNIFTSQNVGFFQKVMPNAIIYNLKFDNFTALGTYTNFGTLAAINHGTIERIEVKNAFLGVQTQVLGGLVAKNITTEVSEGDSYKRNIARIDRTSVSLNVGQKYALDTNERVTLETIGNVGIIGGIVGVNEGGNVLYSYVNGDVYFGVDTSSTITYGGLIGINSYQQLTKQGGVFTSVYQGANIKDCYSNIQTHLMATQASGSKLAGAIAQNVDLTYENFDGDGNRVVVQNYLIGIYYNINNLNAPQNGITKAFKGIHTFTIGANTVVFNEKESTVLGLSYENMKDASKYVSHKTKEIEFDENGKSLGIVNKMQLWLFDTVWAKNDDVNDGMPYLNYQLVYIPDDFRSVGVPIVENNNNYTFEVGMDYPIEIISGSDGKLTIKQSTTHQLLVSPIGSQVTWTTSDSEIVSVTASGLITGEKIGVATITATTKGGSSSTITVIVEEVSYIISNYPEEINIEVGSKYTISGINVTPTTSYSYLIQNSAVATVSGSEITGLREGWTYLFITAGKTRVAVKVNVYQTTQVVNIAVNYTTITRYITDSKTGTISVTSAMVNGVDEKSSLSFSYTSSNSDVVSINASGQFTIKSVGIATVTVSSTTTNRVGSAYVHFYITEQTTEPKPLETISLNYSSASLNVGSTLQLQAATTATSLVFSTTSSAIATVSSGGLVTAVKGGTATITATITRWDGSKAYATCLVTVKTPTSSSETISFNYSSITIYENESRQLTASGTAKAITYTTSNSNVAIVSSSGLVRGVSKGSATISAYFTNDLGNQVYTYCTANVLEVQAVISLTPTSSMVNVGGIVNITASVNKSGTLTWSYSNGGLGTITTVSDTQKRIQMNASGTMTITVKLGSASSTATITAKDPTAYSQDIYTVDQLNAVRYNLDRVFYIKADIDLSGIIWTPIGTKENPFTGQIIAYQKSAGVYFTINNMTTSTTIPYSGLFGYASGASFNNISISSGEVVGVHSGGVVGYATSSKIYNCSVSGSSITGYSTAGGIAGQIVNGSVLGYGKVTSTTVKAVMGANITEFRSAGGIAGYAAASSITQSSVSAAGSISLGSSVYGYVGGIVGSTNNRVSYSWVSANISSNNSDKDYAGGIVGYTTGTIEVCTIKSATITGYYAGGIGGAINNGATVTLNFSKYDKGYRKSDLSNYNLPTAVNRVAVKDTVTVKGNYVGGLFGVINAGVVTNCYTMATLNGTSSNSIKGGFAANIKASGFKKLGGSGQAGVIDYCYSAVKFTGSGENYAISASLVHNYALFGSDSNREAGYAFNYVFDSTLAGKAVYSHGSTLGDNVKAKNSTSNMKKPATYTDKGFSATYWNLTNGSYPTLKGEF